MSGFHWSTWEKHCAVRKYLTFSLQSYTTATYMDSRSSCVRHWWVVAVGSMQCFKVSGAAVGVASILHSGRPNLVDDGLNATTGLNCLVEDGLNTTTGLN